MGALIGFPAVQSWAKTPEGWNAQYRVGAGGNAESEVATGRPPTGADEMPPEQLGQIMLGPSAVMETEGFGPIFVSLDRSVTVSGVRNDRYVTVSFDEAVERDAAIRRAMLVFAALDL